MSDKVLHRIDIREIDAPEDDIWAEFRRVERITRELTQTFKYSHGKYSRFFIELENKRFMATQCIECKKVYAPPRPLCPDCLAVTTWLELSGEGEVITFSILHFSPDSNEDVRQLETPYILAYVLLDGASTLFPHLLKMPIDDVKIGQRVRIHYTEIPVHHPLHLMYFVPLEQS
ncbi:MAG: Zn-ribbon domain-containing OB-fold protein [Chloroflexota bacterium]